MWQTLVGQLPPPVWLPVIPQQDLDFPVHLIEIEFSREERNTVTFSVEAA